MASKLNPGADAALVSAAYRAGMATAPADYSDAFENVARGYEKTMQAQSKLWKDIANIGAVVGADLMQTANEFMDYRIKGGALNPDSAKFLVDELDANKQAQKDLGLFGGILGNSETRQKKRELKIKQAELFAEIDMAAASINAGAEAVAGGLYDSNLDEEGSEMVNAIIKSNLKDKVTTAGNTAVLSRDEKTGELMFTLMRDGQPATGSDGKPKTMTIKEFNKTISMNVDDKGAMQGLLNQLNDDEANAGIKSLNGVYDPERKQMALNKLDGAFKTPTDIRRGMLTKFGYSNTSFADDIKNPSVFSAELYGSLLQATGAGDELALGGITEGIEDTDDSGGISQDEIANNYTRFAANILSVKDPEASKAFLKEYTVKKLEDAYKYGYSKKPPKPTGGTGSGDPKSTGFLTTRKGVYSGNLDRSFSYNVSKTMYDNMKLATEGKEASFLLGGTQYKYDPTKDNWTVGEDDFGNTSALIRNLGIDNDPDFKALLASVSEITEDSTEDIVPNKGESVSLAKGTYSEAIIEDLGIPSSTFTDLNLTNITMSGLNAGDNAVSTSLNIIMPEAYSDLNRQGYYWDAWQGDIGLWKADDPFVEAITLFDGNGDMVKWPEGYKLNGKDVGGDRVKIRVKGKHREDALKQIDAVLRDIIGLDNIREGSTYKKIIKKQQSGVGFEGTGANYNT